MVKLLDYGIERLYLCVCVCFEIFYIYIYIYIYVCVCSISAELVLFISFMDEKILVFSLETDKNLHCVIWFLILNYKLRTTLTYDIHKNSLHRAYELFHQPDGPCQAVQLLNYILLLYQFVLLLYSYCSTCSPFKG